MRDRDIGSSGYRDIGQASADVNHQGVCGGLRYRLAGLAKALDVEGDRFFDQLLDLLARSTNRDAAWQVLPLYGGPIRNCTAGGPCREAGPAVVARS